MAFCKIKWFPLVFSWYFLLLAKLKKLSFTPVSLLIFKNWSLFCSVWREKQICNYCKDWFLILRTKVTTIKYTTWLSRGIRPSDFLYSNLHSCFQISIYNQEVKETLLNYCVQWSRLDDQRINCFIISISAMSFII